MNLLIILILLLTLSIIFSFLALYILFVLIYTKVPFVRTPKKVIEKILLETDINPRDTIYDLGCGDARFLIAVEKTTGAKTIGFEISPWAYFLAKMNIWLKASKTKVHYKNFYKEDLSNANFVFCFLIDTVMPKVGQQLKRQLKKDSTVISFAFAIPGWTPIKEIKPFPEKKNSSKIYIYKT